MLETICDKCSAKLVDGCWIVLTNLSRYRWQVQLWGTETMQVEFVGRTWEEAKEHAMSLTSLFLIGHNPKISVPDSVEWRTVVTHTGRQYKFQSA